MYYCKSRFYVPKWRRWLNNDSINYLEPQNITCLNLFAYYNNNPVMYVDENGNMPKWLKGLCVFWGGAVLTIAAITVAIVGTATLVLVGAAVGAGISACVSATGQLLSTGTLDVGQFLTDVAFGGLLGAFGGTALNLVGMTISSAGIGFLSSVTGDLVDGNSINWLSAICSRVLGGIIGVFGGAGAQNDKLGGVSKYTSRLNTIKRKGLSGRYLKNTEKYLSREKNWLLKLPSKLYIKEFHILF